MKRLAMTSTSVFRFCPLEDYEDIFAEVLKHSKSSLVTLACVTKQFNTLTHAFAKNYRPEVCFGRAEWLSFSGDPGIEPPLNLPLRIIQNFDPDKQILTFIPETINNIPLTLSSIDRFVSVCKNKTESNYSTTLDFFKISDKTGGKVKAHWVLLSKDIFAETCIKGFYEQEKLVRKQKFEIPNLIDTVVSLFMHNLKTGEFVYPFKGVDWTYTSVQETTKDGYGILVGCFSKESLCVRTFIYPNANSGAAGSWRSDT